MSVSLDLGYSRLIISHAEKYGCLRNQLAYILATAYWETNQTVEPVREAYWLSDDWRKSNLRYYPWYGRGFVQLTWEQNYIRAGKELSLDLTSDPDVVMYPDISAQILVHGSMQGWFTGRKIGDYITLHKSDFVNARRVINGNDKAKQIAKLAVAYDALLLAEGYGNEIPRTPEFDVIHPDPAEQPVNWIVKLISAIVGVLSKGTGK